MPVTIDIVIPSYRLNENYILPILRLERPQQVDFKFYLIADNPEIVPGKLIAELVDNKHIFLLINKTNLGAALTRNEGIEAGNGDWILFLDDDVSIDANLLFAYADAVEKYPDETGFIGVVHMPEPMNLFTKIVELSDSLKIFRVANEKSDSPWGATANIMVSRKAIGTNRFSDKFPKTGGGEEVDFFLRVRDDHAGNNYKCLPSASVTHPWWNNGRTGFKRFYKYGIGNSFLGERNPQYAWYDFLNTTETLMFLIVAVVLTGLFNLQLLDMAVGLIAYTVLIEYLVNILRLYKNEGKIYFIEAFGVMLLRNIYESGILMGNLSRLRLHGIGERFNYDGSTKKTHFRFNRYKIIKLVLYAIFIFLVLY